MKVFVFRERERGRASDVEFSRFVFFLSLLPPPFHPKPKIKQRLGRLGHLHRLLRRRGLSLTPRSRRRPRRRLRLRLLARVVGSLARGRCRASGRFFTVSLPHRQFGLGITKRLEALGVDRRGDGSGRVEAAFAASAESRDPLQFAEPGRGGDERWAAAVRAGVGGGDRARVRAAGLRR